MRKLKHFSLWGLARELDLMYGLPWEGKAYIGVVCDPNKSDWCGNIRALEALIVEFKFK